MRSVLAACMFRVIFFICCFLIYHSSEFDVNNSVTGFTPPNFWVIVDDAYWECDFLLTNLCCTDASTCPLTWNCISVSNLQIFFVDFPSCLNNFICEYVKTQQFTGLINIIPLYF